MARTVLVGALILLAAGLAACGAASRTPDPERVVLRVADLPRGYTVGDDSGCSFLTPNSSELAPLLLGEVGFARTCVAQLEKQYGAPGTAPLVESAGVVFGLEKTAEHALEAEPANQLVQTLFEGSFRERGPPMKLRDKTRAYAGSGTFVHGDFDNPGLALVWRDGRLVNVLFLGGVRWEAGWRQAVALARRQQARSESPTPVRSEDNDDRQVALDDPRLDIDVWWLGERFAPGRGVPALELDDARGPFRPGGGPGYTADLVYSTGQRRFGLGLALGLWKKNDWDRFRTGAVGGALGRLGRLVAAVSPCVAARRLALPDRDVALYAAHAPSRSAGYGPPRCVKGSANRYYAAVDLGRTVVTVNLPICFDCFTTGSSTRETARATLLAVARGLRPRPQRGG